jgi:hypothetical protein
MSRVYSFKEYDQYLALKPGMGFWLIALFFLRPYLLKLSTFQRGRGARTAAVSRLYELVYPDDFGFFLAIVATIPSLLLFFALAKRKPGASELVRRIWRNGVMLLLIAAVLNIIVIFIPIFIGRVHGIHILDIVQLVVAALILVYIFRSLRLKDTFADFPAEDAVPSRKR